MNSEQIERIAGEIAQAVRFWATATSMYDPLEQVVTSILKANFPEPTEPELPTSYELYQSLKETSRAIQEGREPEQPESDGLTEEEIEQEWRMRLQKYLQHDMFYPIQDDVNYFAFHFYTRGKQSAKAERQEFIHQIVSLVSPGLECTTMAGIEQNVITSIKKLVESESELESERDELKAEVERLNKEKFELCILLGSAMKVPSPATMKRDMLDGDLSELVGIAITRLKSQPIEPEPLPPAYGYCPHCRSEGISRERRPNGNDTCKKGHVYPSSARVEAARTK